MITSSDNMAWPFMRMKKDYERALAEIGRRKKGEAEAKDELPDSASDVEIFLKSAVEPFRIVPICKGGHVVNTGNALKVMHEDRTCGIWDEDDLEDILLSVFNQWKVNHLRKDENLFPTLDRRRGEYREALEEYLHLFVKIASLAVEMFGEWNFDAAFYRKYRYNGYDCYFYDKGKQYRVRKLHYGFGGELYVMMTVGVMSPTYNAEQSDVSFFSLGDNAKLTIASSFIGDINYTNPLEL